MYALPSFSKCSILNILNNYRTMSEQGNSLAQRRCMLPCHCSPGVRRCKRSTRNSSATTETFLRPTPCCHTSPYFPASLPPGNQQCALHPSNFVILRMLYTFNRAAYDLLRSLHPSTACPFHCCPAPHAMDVPRFI